MREILTTATRVLGLALFVVMLLAPALDAAAQGTTGLAPSGVEETAKPLPGLGGAPAREDRAAPQGLLGSLWTWILLKQRALNQAMAAAVKDLKAAGNLTSAAVLAFVAFVYGVLHAAGPGHGKAIISSYVLANERTVRRGILLSFLAAFVQALSAIAVVGVFTILLKSTSMERESAEAWIETVSWGLVAAIGAWLLWRQVRASFAKTPAHASHDTAHDHHHHEHGAVCAECGHAHLPDPKLLDGELTWSKALAIAFSVGIRPCTGAIIVLIFAFGQGLLWAGVFATFSMALGTAITVSILAAMALGSRNALARFGDRDGRWARRVETVAAYGGAGLILLLGSTFFVASLGDQTGF